MKLKKVNQNPSKKKFVIWIMAVILCVEGIGLFGYVFYCNLKLANSVYSYDQKINYYKWLKDDNGCKVLTDINKNFLCWITLDDAKLSMPVVKTNSEEDEGYYLNHDFECKENICGVPYQKYGTNLFETDNTVIVGHSQFSNTDSTITQIFSGLSNYVGSGAGGVSIIVNNFTYKGVLETVNKMYEFEVFSAFRFNINRASENELNIYNATNFSSVYLFNSFVDAAKDMSMISHNVNTSYGDKFLTLLSCSKYNLDDRILVIAKLTEINN